MPDATTTDHKQRIAFTLAVGNPRYGEQALGLARSLRLIGDPTPRVLMTDLSHPDFAKNFDEVIAPPKVSSPFLLKLSVLEVTKADEALFIDSDCLAFKRLAPIFEAGAGAPVAVQGTQVSDGHWYGQLENILPNLGLPEIPRFNGGLIYYSRGAQFEKFAEEAARVATDYPNTGFDLFRGHVPDEPCISVGIARSGIGLILPETCDFMNTPIGLVGNLELDVVRGQCRFIKHSRFDLRLIEPLIFHASTYVYNLCYWKQVWRLEKLERYADAHHYNFISKFSKAKRAVERRLLKLRGYQ